MLTDDEIAQMTLQQRRELMLRLTHGSAAHASERLKLRRLRRRRLLLISAGAAALVPWTAYLAVTLPDRYVVRDWTLTWVGFDVILTVMFATTAVLGILRRHLVVLSAAAAGVLLLCDAWFDVTTANAHDLPSSITLAALVEVPIALLLITGALRLVRIRLVDTTSLTDEEPLWRAPLFPDAPSGHNER